MFTAVADTVVATTVVRLTGCTTGLMFWNGGKRLMFTVAEILAVVVNDCISSLLVLVNWLGEIVAATWCKLCPSRNN